MESLIHILRRSKLLYLPQSPIHLIAHYRHYIITRNEILLIYQRLDPYFCVHLIPRSEMLRYILLLLVDAVEFLAAVDVDSRLRHPQHR